MTAKGVPPFACASKLAKQKKDVFVDCGK